MDSRIILLLGLLLSFIFASCDVVDNISKRSVVDIPLDNQNNCTPIYVYDANGDQLGVVPAHTIGQVQASRRIFDAQDETYIAFQTPPETIARIQSGDHSVLPKGCRNWGYDNTSIKLRDGYDVELERVRLRPPDYWERPEDW